jgi:hypothetical protein
MNRGYPSLLGLTESGFPYSGYRFAWGFSSAIRRNRTGRVLYLLYISSDISPENLIHGSIFQVDHVDDPMEGWLKSGLESGW